ncbi:MAG: GDSL-type esterase/lipase family protein [Phycisphaeraceae bacterium]|nr:GDSL-type esterase/lipase family protein [Phycisphaeraceae bacterium]
MPHARPWSRRELLGASAAALAGGANLLAQGKKPNPDPKRFAKAIAAFRKWDSQNAWPKNPVLFVGSSSIRMWPTRQAFADLPVINRGFGGSHLSDVIHYADQIVLPYRPKVILLYAGDNDVGQGKPPKQVIGDCHAFTELVWKQLPETSIVFLPIKPSRKRWALWEKMDQVNQAVRADAQKRPRAFYADTASPMLASGRPPAADLFLKDNLHLSDKGYAMWNKVVRATLKDVLKP